MAEFAHTTNGSERKSTGRYTVTLNAANLVADFKLEGRACYVTIELTGGGSVAQTVQGTGVLVRTATAADESYENKAPWSTFTLTLGTSALITIDVVRDTR